MGDTEFETAAGYWPGLADGTAASEDNGNILVQAGVNTTETNGFYSASTWAELAPTFTAVFFQIPGLTIDPSDVFDVNSQYLNNSSGNPAAASFFLEDETASGSPYTVCFLRNLATERTCWSTQTNGPQFTTGDTAEWIEEDGTSDTSLADTGDLPMLFVDTNYKGSWYGPAQLNNMSIEIINSQKQILAYPSSLGSGHNQCPNSVGGSDCFDIIRTDS